MKRRTTKPPRRWIPPTDDTMRRIFGERWGESAVHRAARSKAVRESDRIASGVAELERMMDFGGAHDR